MLLSPKISPMRRVYNAGNETIFLKQKPVKTPPCNLLYKDGLTKVFRKNQKQNFNI